MLNFAGVVDGVTQMDGMVAISGVTGGSKAFTLGPYSFGPDNYEATWKDHLFVHEYGHYIQAQHLGPLYWGVVAAPSLLSASHIFSNDHKRHWFEIDASRKGAEYFDKKYGRGAKGYNAKDANFFDIESFVYGRKSKYVNPRTRKNNDSKYPITDANFHLFDYIWIFLHVPSAIL